MSSKCDARINVPVTQQMRHLVGALARRQHITVADVARQAIREYLDAQEDVIGSRSRFGSKVARQLEELQNRLSEQQIRADAMLLAAIILQQMRRGAEGSEVLAQVVQLTDHAGEEIRAALVAAMNEMDFDPRSKSRPAR